MEEIYTIDEVYGCDFAEFCRKTYTTPEIFIRAIRAEIAMLKIAREKYRKQYMTLKWDDPTREHLEGLIIEINRRIVNKTEKLNKYKKYVKKLHDEGGKNEN